MRGIDGSTRLAGVIGTPLAHSLSPAMHNAAYEQLGLDWVYVPLEVRDEVGLRRLVAAIRSLDFVGFNVTMPFKRDVLDLCDEVATAAQMAGAVNTVHCLDGRLVGYNTDGRGLLESLELEAGFAPADTEVVVLGTGGAAGAAVVALILARAARVTIASRDVARAETLIAARGGPRRRGEARRSPAAGCRGGGGERIARHQCHAGGHAAGRREPDTRRMGAEKGRSSTTWCTAAHSRQNSSRAHEPAERSRSTASACLSARAPWPSTSGVARTCRHRGTSCAPLPSRHWPTRSSR